MRRTVAAVQREAGLREISYLLLLLLLLLLPFTI
jgi:hypothetical protein